MFVGSGGSITILSWLLKYLLRHGVRGSTRLTMSLPRFVPALRRVPIPTPLGGVLFLDLRLPSCHRLLCDPTLFVEPEELLIMRSAIHPGDTVFDIGTHIGTHAITMAHLVGPQGKVICF